MRMASLLATTVGLLAAAPGLMDAIGQPAQTPRKLRRFTDADAERLAKAEAKRARKAARRARGAQGESNG